MAVRTPAELKSFFQTGDYPTQSQFEDLIDSIVSTGNFVPYTSATTNVDLNTKTLSNVSTLSVNTSTTSPLIIGGSGTTQTLIYKTTTGTGTSGADHIFQVGNNGATEAMRILNSGSIGIGTTSPSAKLHVVSTTESDYGLYAIQTLTNVTTNGRYGTLGILDITPTADLDSVAGSYSGVRIRGTQNTTSINVGPTGIYCGAVNYSTAGTITSLSGMLIDVRNLETGTITNAYGVKVRTMSTTGGGGGGTVTNTIGLYVNDQTLATNNIGIQSDVSSGSNKWNLYVTGTAQNYLNGTLGIGQTVPTAYLHIKAGTATASTAPIKLTTGTVNTTAEAGAIEYNNTFHVTNSDATRRHIATAPNATKVTAAAPYTNDGYIVINIAGTDFKVMTTA